MRTLFTGCLLLVALSVPAFAGQDRGGGNGVNQRLVESYYKSVEEISGYNEFLRPTLDDVKEKLPVFGAWLEETMSKMSWYIVPKKLKPVASEITGIPFESDQIAVNSDGEVFIDQDLFSAMNVTERGRLLLHEVLEWPLLNSGRFSYAFAMRIVRLSVITVARAPSLTADQLAKEMKKAWLGAYADTDFLSTKDELDKRAKEKAAKEEEAKRKADEDREQNMPTFRTIAATFFHALDTYCRAVGDRTFSYKSIESLSWAEQREIQRDLMTLGNAVVVIGYKAGKYDRDETIASGYTLEQMNPGYSDALGPWVRQQLFGKVAYIPSPDLQKNREPLREKVHFFTDLHRSCENLPAIKEQVANFINGTSQE